MALGRYGNPEAVVLDLSTVGNYLLRQQQEKKLMQQQLDRQVSDDLAKLSIDGARPQDLSAIRQSYDAFRNAAIQYKRALRDPKTRDMAEQNYLNSKAQLNTIISESKGRKELTKQIYDFYGKNRHDINEDEFRKNMSLVNAPWGTSEFEQGKDFDLSKITFKPEQFQADKWQAIVNAIKPQDVSTSIKLPNGQISIQKRKVVDPRVLSQTISGLYDSDLGHGKKYWDTQFASLQPEDKQIYEEYTNKYLPGFEINNPKDLAIAANMYGRVEQDLGNEIKGTDRDRIEAFQRQMQAEREARADARQARSIAARGSKKDEPYYVEDDIAKAMRSGEGRAAIAPFESAASPGVLVQYVKDGKFDKRQLDQVYNSLKKDGVDAKTRLMSRSDFGKGAIFVAVPKINNKTKAVIPGQYDYMAVSTSDPNLESRINALLNYTKGGTPKTLPPKFYRGRLNNPAAYAEEPQDTEYAPGEFDDVDEQDN